MIKLLSRDHVFEGTTITPLVKTPTNRQLVQYAGASGDYYEIHYDQAIAQSAGLEDVIVHGALKGAFLAEMLSNWAGHPTALRKLGVQYRGMDIVGKPITCKGIVTNTFSDNSSYFAECDVWTENEQGQRTTVGHAGVNLGT